MTTSSAFASLLFIRVHMCQKGWLNNNDCGAIDVELKSQAERILSDVHLLAYVCNQFFKDVHTKITIICGAEFVHFDYRSVVSHLHCTLRELSTVATKFEQPLEEIMRFIIELRDTMVNLRDCHLRLLWRL